MNRLRQGQLWLNKRMGQYAGIGTVIYHYGNDEVVTLTDIGWEGRTAFRVQDNGNTRLHWNELDILVPVDKLKNAEDVLILPKKGHWVEIIYTAPDSTQHFEISAMDGEQEWRYSDPQRTRYRLHLKAKKRT